MKKILRHTWKTVRYNLGSLLIFETGYRILSFFLAMRLVKTAIEIIRGSVILQQKIMGRL